jgi:hydroxypyruvate reductase
VIASGETTVHVRGDGRGGRNLEFALGMATALAGEATPVAAASAGTDGVDGVTDAAGALVDPSTLDRARRAGLDPAAALAANDTYPFFRTLGDLIVWGPTGTNAGDLHVVVSG